jgi:hypothetical protein
MIPDSRRLDLERELLAALQQGSGTPSQRLMAPGVQEALQQLFLDQSDAVLQPLLVELSEWQTAQRTGPSAAVLSGVRRLSGLALDQRLDAIRALSEALYQAMMTASAAAVSTDHPGVSSTRSATVADCQQGAEELARLLFLYAAGQRRDVSPEVLARLQG